MAQVAGVNDEIGLVGQPVDLIDGRLKRAGDIRVGWLGETDMAVADLHEVELALRGLHFLAKSLGTDHAAANGPGHARSRPSHALEKSPAVNTVSTVVLMIVSYLLCQSALRGQSSY